MLKIKINMFFSLSITRLATHHGYFGPSLIFLLIGLLQAVFWGLGNGGGSVISGALYHEYGPVVTFQIFAVASGTTALYLFIAYRISNKLNIPDLTSMERFYYLPIERSKPAGGGDDVSIADSFYDEGSDQEPLSYLKKN